MDSSKDFERQVLDTRILQKVNAAHRGAFVEKFPGQVEHSLRLVSERLQLGLAKHDGLIITEVDTWNLLPSEIRDLAEAMHYLNDIRMKLKE